MSNLSEEETLKVLEYIKTDIINYGKVIQDVKLIKQAIERYFRFI